MPIMLHCMSPLRHLADNQTAPSFVRFWATADNGGFWREMVCPLMTRSSQNKENIKQGVLDPKRTFDTEQAAGYRARMVKHIAWLRAAQKTAIYRSRRL